MPCKYAATNVSVWMCFCVWGFAGSFRVSYTVQPCLLYSALGGSQCLGGCHPFHYECLAGLPHLLADFQYHGCQHVCGKILLLLQCDWKSTVRNWCSQQQIRMPSIGRTELHWGALEKRQNQLWQCGFWLLGSTASGKSTCMLLFSSKMVLWLKNYVKHDIYFPFMLLRQPLKDGWTSCMQQLIHERWDVCANLTATWVKVPV